MPKIQTVYQRRYRYDVIAKAEGDECIVCHMAGRHRSPPHYRLIIEHTDNNQINWAWTNLHLVCYSCNQTMANNLKSGKWSLRYKISLLQAYSDQLERDRERDNYPTWQTVLVEDLGANSNTPEIRLHRFFLPRWRKYVHQLLTSQGSMTRKELILNAAKKVGCSKLTSTNYFEVEAASLEGILKEVPDDDGNMVVVFAYHKEPSISGNGHGPNGHKALEKTELEMKVEK